jgi:hypothetical protein
MAWTGAGKMACMRRFSIRDLVLVTAIVALIAALLMERHARRNERLVTVNWTSEEEREWAREKFKAAKAEFEQFESRRYGTGPGFSMEETCCVIERFAQTAEELPADPETRLKELEAALKFAKELESVTREQYHADVQPQYSWNRTQNTRADVETRLKRVQREAVLARAQK